MCAKKREGSHFYCGKLSLSSFLPVIRVCLTSELARDIWPAYDVDLSSFFVHPCGKFCQQVEERERTENKRWTERKLHVERKSLGTLVRRGTLKVDGRPGNWREGYCRTLGPNAYAD